MNTWTIDKARQTYNIAAWGDGYFDVNEQGHLLVRPKGAKSNQVIDLYALSQEIQAQGLSLPVLIRFTDILSHRIDSLRQAFGSAIAGAGHSASYTAVYPIKVNQQHSVVEVISKGGDGHTGLEAGSKSELMAVLGQAPQGGTVICNGYKDREYIHRALIGQALGHRLFLVIEKLSELPLILDCARTLDIRPLIGLRARLAFIGSGNWQNTGGDKSKFGLSADQLLQAIGHLREAGMLDCVKMLHFHMGSQIPDLADIQTGLEEGARIFAELSRRGMDIQVVNIGGGLGVDYEGTGTSHSCSMNYTLKGYAQVVIGTLSKVCKENNFAFPEIMTEAGRAMTAHHAMLMTHVVETESRSDEHADPPPDKSPALVQNLWEILQSITSQTAVKVYDDARRCIEEIQAAFNSGNLDLSERARAENIFYAICRQVRQQMTQADEVQRQLIDELNDKLAEKYFCNFSLFQSMPDAWAIEQVFPVVPLNRLDEAPTRRGVIEDITCDSDGRLDFYPNAMGVEPSLPLHEVRDGEPYLLGIFLLGAYQEILGDIHNLFGDTDSVHVEITDTGHQLNNALRGDDVGAVLRYVHFDPEVLLACYQHKIGQADLDEKQKAEYLDVLKAGLEGYTYLED